MQVEVVTGSVTTEKAELLVVNLFEGETSPGGATGAVDAALGGQVSRVLARGDFRGKLEETLVLYPDGKIPAARVIVAGLGERQKLSYDAVRKAAATAARKARDLGAAVIHTIVHGAGVGGLDCQKAAEAVTEGTILGLYCFRELKTEKADRPDVHRLVLVEQDPAKAKAIEQGRKTGQVIAESACFARDLANLPANVLTPVRMAEMASNMAGIAGLNAKVLDETEVSQIGMNAFMSVARGSHHPPRFIVLEHNMGRADLPCVALVGKAVTFDSGGISLKSGDGMEVMKGDMAGGAAVLGAMRAVALLGLSLRMVGLVPATENMPGGGASKPGDVVKSLMGLTVEIISTDAEGRLCLADALTYAREWKPEAIFDIATLTGACSVALGNQAAGGMGDERLLHVLAKAGDVTGERVWPLPLFEEYDEQIKSDVADVKNVGGRPAGALTAGRFLKKFVPGGTPWAHIDMAGLSREDKGRPYVPKGATGYGVRLLVELLRNWGTLNRGYT
jgi:leucyl aminopeptidase